MEGKKQLPGKRRSRVLLHKTVPVVILNVRIATKSRDYKINTKLVKLI